MTPILSPEELEALSPEKLQQHHVMLVQELVQQGRASAALQELEMKVVRAVCQDQFNQSLEDLISDQE